MPVIAYYGCKESRFSGLSQAVIRADSGQLLILKITGAIFAIGAISFTLTDRPY